MAGINFWILLAYLPIISVFVGLNPQQPVDSQTIIDSFIGLMVGMFIGALVSRLIWPVSFLIERTCRRLPNQCCGQSSSAWRASFTRC